MNTQSHKNGSSGFLQFSSFGLRHFEQRNESGKKRKVILLQAHQGLDRCIILYLRASFFSIFIIVQLNASRLTKKRESQVFFSSFFASLLVLTSVFRGRITGRAYLYNNRMTQHYDAISTSKTIFKRTGNLCCWPD